MLACEFMEDVGAGLDDSGGKLAVEENAQDSSLKIMCVYCNKLSYVLLLYLFVFALALRAVVTLALL